MTQAPIPVIRFAGVELDRATRELRRDGAAIALEPRVFALLEYLASNRDRAVDKDEIQHAVWTGRIVSETALTRAIMKARRAVGDSAAQQSVIRTVHGHGYQFVAELEDVAPLPSNPAADVPPPDVAPLSAPQPTSGPTTIRWVAVAAMVAVVGFAVWLWPANPSASAIRVAVMPVNNATNDPELGWTKLGLMGFANDLMYRTLGMDVVASSDVLRFTESDGRSDDDAAAHTEALRRQFGISHLLTSRLEKNAGGLRLTYALHGIDGRVAQGTMVGTQPTSLMKGLVQTVARDLGQRSRQPVVIDVVSDDPFINEAHSRGLSFALEGRCAEAQPLFDVVTASTAQITNAHFEAARCNRVLGHWQEAQAQYEGILTRLPDGEMSAERAKALNGLGTVFIRTGRIEQAGATYQEALRHAAAAGDPFLQGQVLSSLSIEARNRREFAEARDYLARATLAYHEAELEELPGEIPAAMANIDMAQGKLEQAAEQLDIALERYRGAGDRRKEAMMLNNYGYLRRLQGRFGDARDLHLQSLAIRRDIGDRVGQGRILGMLSILYTDEGDLQQARLAASEAVDIAREANDSLFIATGLAQLAQVDVATGDTQSAVELYRESKTLFDQIGDISRSVQVALRLARIEMIRGNHAVAAEHAAASLVVAQRDQLDEPIIDAFDLLGDLAQAQHQPEAALAAYRDALEHIDLTRFTTKKMAVTVKLAGVHLDLDDVAACEPLMGFLIEQIETPDSLRVQARYAYATNDPARAVRWLEAAREMAGDDWSPSDAETLQQYQAALAAAQRMAAP